MTQSEYFANGRWAVDRVRHRQSQLTSSPWYRLPMGPSTDPSTVDAYERKYGFTLPDDYRAFLIDVGDGGGGPDCYMRPLGAFPIENLIEHGARVDDPNQNPDFAAGANFPFETYTVLPVPTSPAIACDPRFCGSLVIADKGCATWVHLVLTGPLRGEIWECRGLEFGPVVQDPAGMPPHVAVDLASSALPHTTFADWYTAWLGSGPDD